MLLKNSSTSFLSILGYCGIFSWNWLPLRGRCVGILGGFCTHRFDIINFSSGKFYIRLVVLDKKIQFFMGFGYRLWGSSGRGYKSFLSELEIRLYFLIGGVFNLLRFYFEKK
jgi:hypothetical protein